MKKLHFLKKIDIFATNKKNIAILIQLVKPMKTQKMHDEESYELDNVYNDEDRFYTRGDSSVWYN